LCPPESKIMETPLIAEHRAANAFLAEYRGCILPEKFSDADTEYRAAKETVALFDTNWHATFSLSGPDRVRYLNAIVSNDIKSVGEAYGTRALLLNPQGHILAELEVYALAEKLLVRTHASVRERTFATLDKFIIMDDVTLEDLTDRLGSFAVEGPQAGTVVAQACSLALEGFSEFANAELPIDGVTSHLVRLSHFGGTGAEIIAPREHLGLLWQSMHARVHAAHGASIGMTTLNSLRLEAGIPWFPDDFNDTVIPHEAALEATHLSFTKGCYTGQEIVERVRSRGQVNRRRVSLKFSSVDPPAPLTRLHTNDAAAAEVGIITSSAFSPKVAAAIGMAYVRREHNAPGTVLALDGGTATVTG
jgi:folate-binding protein YgfZ